MIDAEKKYNGKVVDCHSHILPGIDDGSVDMEMSLEMLRMAAGDGVTDLFLTSHGFEVMEDPAHVKETFEQVRQAAEDQGISIRLHGGCEIFFDMKNNRKKKPEENMAYFIEQLQAGNLFPYWGTKYVLTEYYYHADKKEALMVAKALLAAGYVPVIAHLERYPHLVEAGLAEKLVKLGCMIQINAYSLVEERKEITRETARYLLNKGLVSFLGSDAHRTTHRPPMVGSGVQYIWENCEEAYARAVLYENAEKYLMQ